MSHVTIQQADHVVRVTLNRPDVRNAFNEAVIAELTAWAHSVRAFEEEIKRYGDN